MPGLRGGGTGSTPVTSLATLLQAWDSDAGGAAQEYPARGGPGGGGPGTDPKGPTAPTGAGEDVTADIRTFSEGYIKAIEEHGTSC